MGAGSIILPVLLLAAHATRRRFVTPNGFLTFSRRYLQRPEGRAATFRPSPTRLGAKRQLVY